jgi:cation transport regulator ChaC
MGYGSGLQKNFNAKQYPLRRNIRKVRRCTIVRVTLVSGTPANPSLMLVWPGLALFHACVFLIFPVEQHTSLLP